MLWQPAISENSTESTCSTQQCPIECVITVEALKEGLGLLLRLRLLLRFAYPERRGCRAACWGRVLRMPYAKRHKAAEYEQSLCLSSAEPSFGDAARALVDKLVARWGSRRTEARDNIEPIAGWVLIWTGRSVRPATKSKPKPTFTAYDQSNDTGSH